jgi:RNA polymerase sigma-70 factor (ECF subfamily)
VDQRSDEALVRAVRAGEIAAFDVLYARYEQRLFGYMSRLVDDRALAEDLFQDVFFGVLQDRTFDPTRGRFSAWVFTVARNRCLEVRRRATARAAAAGPPVPEPERVDDVVDSHARVRAAMDRLPEGQRQLLMLKQVGELTYEEIAGLLGIAEGTVKSRVHAATKAFRRQLGDPT